MLSKEEIEKAKERIQKSLNDIWFGTLYSQEENDEDEKILLQYIDQLEQENNKQNEYCLSYEEDLSITEVSLRKAEMIINEMAKWIYEKDYNSQEIMLICERNRDYYSNNIEKVKQYFEKKVEGE